MANHDLVVIGSGPGGYTAAIRAAQLGMDVACVDLHAVSGGTCLRVGCIPSKALLESSEIYARTQSGLAAHGIKVGSVELDVEAMQRRKERVVQTLTKGIDYLLKKNKITRYTGRARLDGPDRVVVATEDGDQVITAKRVLIATGSKPALLPGMDPADGIVSTSTEALAFTEVPKRLVVIGAGFIGLEIGSVWNRLGSEVTVVEYSNRILPGADGEIAEQAKSLLARQGLNFMLESRVESVERGENDVIKVKLASGETLECDRVLLAIGRVPNTEGLGLETVGITCDDRGFIHVDARFQTAATGVFAVGDVIGGALLAHKAEKEGIACVEGMAGEPVIVNHATIPAVTYTDPEIASVGFTEEQLIQANREYRKGVFPFRANGRARTLDAVDGIVKILADAATDRLLGVHIVGPRAGDMIAEAVAAMDFGASAEDLIHVSHAHPSLSEVIKEAALAVHGRSIHG